MHTAPEPPRLSRGDSNNEDPTMQDEDPRNVPFMQQILDNPFILLFIGIAIPTLTYIVWGIMELVSLPISSP
jgi:hypothetical protein